MPTGKSVSLAFRLFISPWESVRFVLKQPMVNGGDPFLPSGKVHVLLGKCLYMYTCRFSVSGNGPRALSKPVKREHMIWGRISPSSGDAITNPRPDLPHIQRFHVLKWCITWSRLLEETMEDPVACYQSIPKWQEGHGFFPATDSIQRHKPWSLISGNQSNQMSTCPLK